MSSIYLLLDDKSKMVVKTGLTSLPANGVHLITDVTELDKCEEKSTLFVLECILQNPGYLSEIEMYKELFKLRVIFMHTDDLWVHEMSKIAECYKCELSLLDFSMLQAAMYQDYSYSTEEHFTSAEIAMAKNVKLSNSSDTEKVRLAESLLVAKEREDRLLEEITGLEERLDSVVEQCARDKATADLILSSYKEVIANAKVLADNLKQYEIIFSRSVYQKINIHSYPNRPVILYFKEYQEITNFDLFIETLVSSIRLQRRESAKVLRLYDNSGSRRVKVLPSYYKVLYNRIASKDVNTEDYLCKTGDYTKVLDLLLLNKINANVLIIVDCKDHSDLILNGSCLQYAVCRQRKFLSAFSLSPENTIVADSEESVLNWGTYDVEGKTNDEKFVYLSSTPAIRKVLADLEEFRNQL